MIPFNKPFATGRENKYIMDALKRSHISGDGYYTKKVQLFMEKTFQTYKVLMTTSCSSALDMSAILLDLKEGDEVILPSYTFVSTANAVLLRGVTPVFADIQADTLNIDPEDIERKITSKTKAIFPVHYAGISCGMERIMRIADDNNLKVVEDAAQGVNAKYCERYLGTIGDIGCYSFHETKNYSCGEGGAILINSANKDLIERAEIIREKGTNRSKFYRGEIDKYTWVDIGSSFLPSDILAAFLYAQLEKMDDIKNRRKEIYDYYDEGLENLEKNGKLRRPIIPDKCDSNYHMFYILLNSNAERDNVMDRLKEKGIMAVFHYIPLHLSPMGRKYGYKSGDLAMTEDLSSRLLRLPMYYELTRTEQDYIIENLYDILSPSKSRCKHA